MDRDLDDPITPTMVANMLSNNFEEKFAFSTVSHWTKKLIDTTRKKMTEKIADLAIQPMEEIQNQDNLNKLQIQDNSTDHVFIVEDIEATQYKMENNVSILSVIGYIAPLFGFLGTIIGMFQLFYNIASTGEYSISNIAGGIYVKMISSAGGLIIGIIAYIMYRYLNSQIDKTTNKMEVASAEFIDILQKQTR